LNCFSTSEGKKGHLTGVDKLGPGKIKAKGKLGPGEKKDRR
jgi:hypothetical protein